MNNKKEYADRVGEEKLNNHGYLMKIINYNLYSDIVVEFQDEYRAKVHTTYGNFKKGNIGNPYGISIYNVGIVGEKYKTSHNKIHTKEYNSWCNMIERCFDEKLKSKRPTYIDVKCCDKWLLFENFYEWIHSQENFDKWLNNDRWHLDKDILFKGNKVYAPENCCLVPNNINTIFIKSDAIRGDLPIGVVRYKNRYRAQYNNNGKRSHIGVYDTIEEAFLAYKEYKENLIKQIAQKEYFDGNITKQCHDAMMKYKVEITD